MPAERSLKMKIVKMPAERPYEIFLIELEISIRAYSNDKVVALVICLILVNNRGYPEQIFVRIMAAFYF